MEKKEEGHCIGLVVKDGEKYMSLITYKLNEIIEKLGGEIPSSDNLNTTKVNTIIEIKGGTVPEDNLMSSKLDEIITLLGGVPEANTLSEKLIVILELLGGDEAMLPDHLTTSILDMIYEYAGGGGGDKKVSDTSLNRFDEVWLDGYEWKFINGIATLVENPNCMASKNKVTFPGGFKRGDSNIGWWSSINVNGYMMCCKADGTSVAYLPQLERRGRYWDNTAEFIGYPSDRYNNPDTEFAYGLLYVVKKDGVTPDTLKTLIADAWHYNCSEYIPAEFE
ncbi:hypothetical protein [Bacillus infantis]|uniref:hypothetical protein n=1 Tax=Bacillus infantis TaxID=324767 RepID=UPI003CF88399